jgi:hypothetical protein
MKWKGKKMHTPGKLRTKKMFAFIPVRLDDDYIVWLQEYFRDQRFKFYVPMGIFDVEEWDTIKTYD